MIAVAFKHIGKERFKVIHPADQIHKPGCGGRVISMVAVIDLVPIRRGKFFVDRDWGQENTLADGVQNFDHPLSRISLWWGDIGHRNIHSIGTLRIGIQSACGD